MKKIAEKQRAATPLPSRGGVRGGVCIFLPLNKLVTPPLPLPYKGGECHAACSSTVEDFLK